MPHALQEHELRIWDRSGRILAAGRRKERIIAPVDDECWRDHGPEPCPTVAGYGDRRDLTGEAIAILGATGLLYNETTRGGLVERVTPAGDAAREGQAMG